MWGGLFEPFDIRKHRDYAHATWLEHLLDHDGSYKVQDDQVMCHTDPITDREFEYDKPYFVVELMVPQGKGLMPKKYEYLVPSNGWNIKPNKEKIAETLQRYAETRTEFPRNIMDYISDDQELQA